MKKNKQNTLKKNCIIPFLLGTLVGKVSINHRYKRLVLHLPYTKRMLARKFKEHFGTQVYYKTNKTTYSCYMIVTFESKKSFKRLHEAVVACRPSLPHDYLQGIEEFLKSVIEI